MLNCIRHIKTVLLRPVTTKTGISASVTMWLAEGSKAGANLCLLRKMSKNKQTQEENQTKNKHTTTGVFSNPTTNH